MSSPMAWERFGPWSLASSIPKRGKPLLLGHTRDTQQADGLPRSPSLSCRAVGSPGRQHGPPHAPGMTEHSSPGRAPHAAAAALGV